MIGWNNIHTVYSSSYIINNVPNSPIQRISNDSSSTLLLIVYGPSDDVHQQQMAYAIEKGANMKNVKVCSVDECSFQDVVTSDALVVGSAVYNANVHPDVQTWINTWDFHANLQNKIASAFVTGGGISAGEEGVLISLLKSMMIFQMIVVGGSDWKSAFGAYAITNEGPFNTHHLREKNSLGKMKDTIDPMFLANAHALGARVAKMVVKFKKCNEPLK